MAWQFIAPTANEQWAWASAGACEFCGDRSSAAGCVCRWCTSCSSYWVQLGPEAKRAPIDEDGPHREDCPECRDWAESPEGHAELDRQRIQGLFTGGAVISGGKTDARECRNCGDVYWYDPAAELQWYWCGPCIVAALAKARGQE